MHPMVTAPPPQRHGLMAKERGSSTGLFISKCIAKFYSLSQRVCISALVLAGVNEKWETVVQLFWVGDGAFLVH